MLIKMRTQITMLPIYTGLVLRPLWLAKYGGQFAVESILYKLQTGQIRTDLRHKDLLCTNCKLLKVLR